jgi:putative ABC transport system permease protein
MNSTFVVDSDMGFIAPIAGLSRMRDWDLAGNWNNLSIGNMTYVLLSENLDEAWLNSQMDSIFARMVPDDQKEVIADLTVTPLQQANLAVWDMIGMPVIAVVSLLSFLVLVVACVNYTNLATAQSLGRSREVGMRKTMGATQKQPTRVLRLTICASRHGCCSPQPSSACWPACTRPG